MLTPAISGIASLSRRERISLMALAALSLLTRFLAFSRYRFDSDEPQHLHVAWGWTAGLLQYRDLFDNHAPLFHMAMAPLLQLAGERPDILLVMRAPMLLLFAAVVVCTWIIGARLYSQRVGLWAAVLLSIVPTFFLKSLEFRTDNLWNTFWMLGLVLLTTPLSRREHPADPEANRLWTPRPGHALLAGLVFGFAAAVSLKTSLLLITLTFAALISGAMRVRLGDRRSVWRASLALCAGVVVVPAIIASYFWSRGAWQNLVYCVATFNELVPSMRSPVSLWVPRLLYVPAMIVVLRVAWRNRANRETGMERWRFFLAVATAVFFITLGGFWILISPRDFLPFLPLLSIFLVAAILRTTWPARLMTALVLLCMVGIWRETDGFANHTAEHITLMQQVLRLTRPGEPLMDFKGETIYRPRPYYFIFEFITRNAITRGLIADTVPEAVIRSRCHVAEADGPFWPPRAAAFLNANFVDVGRLRASGQAIGPGGGFTIAVPGEYVVVRKQGEAAGMLDGTPYAGARQLGVGAHRFTTAGSDRLACLWAQAWKRGFSPFHLQDRDF